MIFKKTATLLLQIFRLKHFTKLIICGNNAALRLLIPHLMVAKNHFSSYQYLAFLPFSSGTL